MSRHLSSRRSRTVAIAGLAGAGLVAAACGSTGDPGVDVQQVQAAVVFGVEFADDDAPVVPAVETFEPDAQTPSFDSGALAVPFRNRVPTRFQNVANRIPAPENVECPKASLGASVDAAAPEAVTTEPKPGLYKWKRDITVTRTLGGSPITISTKGFENRVVRAVEVVGEGTNPTTDVAGKQFTYEVVRPDGFGSVIVDQYRVNTDPLAAGQTITQDPAGIIATGEGVANQNGVPLDVPDEVQNQVKGGQRVRVGEPNRGVLLTGRELYDGNGQLAGSTSFNPPALLLPLNVQVGDSWRSTSIDSRNGQVLTVEGAVSERKAVDACGMLLDGWLAKLTFTEASGTGTVITTFESIVSTQLGALLIGENLDLSGLDESGNPITVKSAYSIAQRDPDPAPAL